MKYFQTFTNCLLVKGVKRSLVCDAQRQESDFIPNDMVEILEKLNAKISIETLISEYGKENENIIVEYLQYLDEKEYGFFCELEEFARFPTIDKEFFAPAYITNVVIELTKEKINRIKNIVPQIENIGCKDISLIFYDELEEGDFLKIFEWFYNTRTISLEITSKYHIKITPTFFANINTKLNHLTRLVFFSAKKNEVKLRGNKILFDRVFSIKEITSFNSCGKVDLKYFNTNLPKVLEAINHNSCLHKKIGIDINGNIRNCPSMPQSFGNIKDTTLEEALNRKDFKKYWNLTKDEIEVCKDCEFRYICTDCRAYTERTHTNKDGLDTSKPLKCGYNPYTGEWKEWSKNPLKEKAIKYYGMQDIVKK